MRKLTSFTFITLNGFYKGLNEDTSWHIHGGEAAEFSRKSSGSGNVLLFGRKTYEMMYSFWPSPMAAQHFPEVAVNMNKAEKIVVSQTLTSASWNNSSVLKGDLVTEITKLKSTPGNDITILGSGSIITQLSDAGLIDTYQLMIDPIILKEGVNIFNGIKNNVSIQLKDVTVLKNDGVMLATYIKV